MKLPSRRDSLAKAKSDGLRVAAVFPIHYPREILRACGFLPVEIWGPPGVDPTDGNAHLQSYTCAIVRNGLSFMMQGKLDVAEAIVMPHTCDALQGLASVCIDFLETKQPVLTVQLPRGGHDSDLPFLVCELRRLAKGLSALSGVEPGESELRAAIEAEQAADRELASLALNRAGVDLDDQSFYALLRCREHMPAESFTELARSAPRSDSAKTSGTPLMISGIVPEPMRVFEHISEAGGRVVADDLACCSRRLYPSDDLPAEGKDPYEHIARRLLGAPPDPTRGDPISVRASYIAERMERSGAKGLLVYDVKFCEPELFDLPMLRRSLAARGFPLLHVEMDLEMKLPQQTVTRIQAFVETIS
jgi:benzoyl-CoA reductase/2-hydroxyglutaryl-CoA dehydratase subunit BcrC/BadD/HgdB